MNPYSDTKINENCYERVFTNNSDLSEMVWHRDLKTREVLVLEGKGWFFQFDNQLPFELQAGNSILVPEMVYHRIYRIGSSPLKIRICE